MAAPLMRLHCVTECCLLAGIAVLRIQPHRSVSTTLRHRPFAFTEQPR
jgi:hypothetical protein